MAFLRPERRARQVWRTVNPILLSLACVLTAQTAFAHEYYRSTELDTEAAFLTRLAPFVDWPLEAFSSSESPLVICAVATDPLARRLAAAAGSEKNDRHPIHVRVVNTFDPLDRCHILYLGGMDDSAIQIARTVRHSPVLTVSRSNGAGRQPAMIIFTLDRGRVHFDIDDATAVRSRLTISSKLLALARNLTPAPVPR